MEIEMSAPKYGFGLIILDDWAYIAGGQINDKKNLRIVKKLI